MGYIGGNPMVIREINVNIVRKALKTIGPSTKQQLSHETGLSLMTVGTVLQYLLKQREVLESELSPSSGGRPARKYSYNYGYAHALAVFPYEREGKTAVRSAIADLSGQIIENRDTEVQVIDLETLVEIVKPLAAAYPAIKSMGLGYPGVDKGGTIILSDYGKLLGTSLSRHFAGFLNIPVAMENDVNAATIGYTSINKLDEGESMVYIYFPDCHPPGAGIFINGRLHRGKDNFAGEIAAIPLDVVWKQSLYQSFQLFCEAAAKLVTTICCIMNPGRIVLNGSFLCEAHGETIATLCKTRLPMHVLPVIELSKDFVADYQAGLIVQALSRLEPALSLEKSNIQEE